MPKIFETFDKLKPVYDKIYDITLFICKVLLIGDILLTCYAVAGRYIPFITAPAWSEEIVLMLMSYMAVLSAALAIRRKAHIRMTAFDNYLPKNIIVLLDFLNDLFVLVLGVIMITEGWKYAMTLGAKAKFTSMPSLSKCWMYFPVPVAGVAMIIFELEALYNHIKSLFITEGGAA